jgi:hypothetical protein
MLWLHLAPILIVVCGRILSFSGAWAGPRKETIPHGSHKIKSMKISTCSLHTFSFSRMRGFMKGHNPWR